MAKRKKKTVWAVVGLILTLFGITGSIPSLINREYIGFLPATGVAVIIGIILMAWAFSD